MLKKVLASCLLCNAFAPGQAALNPAAQAAANPAPAAANNNMPTAADTSRTYNLLGLMKAIIDGECFGNLSINDTKKHFGDLIKRDYKPSIPGYDNFIEAAAELVWQQYERTITVKHLFEASLCITDEVQYTPILTDTSLKLYLPQEYSENTQILMILFNKMIERIPAGQNHTDFYMNALKEIRQLNFAFLITNKILEVADSQNLDMNRLYECTIESPGVGFHRNNDNSINNTILTYILFKGNVNILSSQNEKDRMIEMLRKAGVISLRHLQSMPRIHTGISTSTSHESIIRHLLRIPLLGKHDNEQLIDLFSPFNKIKKYIKLTYTQGDENFYQRLENCFTLLAEHCFLSREGANYVTSPYMLYRLLDTMLEIKESSVLMRVAGAAFKNSPIKDALFYYLILQAEKVKPNWLPENFEFVSDIPAKLTTVLAIKEHCRDQVPAITATISNSDHYMNRGKLQFYVNENAYHSMLIFENAKRLEQSIFRQPSQGQSTGNRSAQLAAAELQRFNESKVKHTTATNNWFEKAIENASIADVFYAFTVQSKIGARIMGVPQITPKVRAAISNPQTVADHAFIAMIGHYAKNQILEESSLKSALRLAKRQTDYEMIAIALEFTKNKNIMGELGLNTSEAAADDTCAVM